MRDLGAPEIILILVVVVLIFGASRLPGVAKAIGQSLKIFRNEMKGLNEDTKPTDAPKDESGDGTAPKA